MERMAFEVMKYLHDRKLWEDVDLYVNGKALSSHRIGTDGSGSKTSPDGVPYFECERDVAVITEYCNPKTLTMTFEGPLYDLINHSMSGKTMEDLNGIFSRYGLYAEQGHAWSLACYE